MDVYQDCVHLLSLRLQGCRLMMPLNVPPSLASLSPPGRTLATHSAALRETPGTFQWGPLGLRAVLQSLAQMHGPFQQQHKPRLSSLRWAGGGRRGGEPWSICQSQRPPESVLPSTARGRLQ
ncbi:unnamed protein product [Gadus morhua 'NCC']